MEEKKIVKRLKVLNLRNTKVYHFHIIIIQIAMLYLLILILYHSVYELQFHIICGRLI